MSVTSRGALTTSCPRCQGSGQMRHSDIDDLIAREKYGREVRDRRVAVSFSGREFAKSCGIAPIRLNQIEHALGDPATKAERLAISDLLWGLESVRE